MQPDLPAVPIRPAHHLPPLILVSIHEPPCQRSECPPEPSLFLSAPPCLPSPMGTACPLRSAKREARGVCSFRILTPALSTKAANINQGPTSRAPLQVLGRQAVIRGNRGAGHVPCRVHSSWRLGRQEPGGCGDRGLIPEPPRGWG